MAPLIMMGGALLAASAWLLTSPSRLLSREMTWDLLFNLAGAWHLKSGHVAHVDFHDPLGRLSFLLTEFGFWLSGPTVFAFLAGEMVVAVAVFIAATLVSARRLPLVPALVFVLFAGQLVLMPINVGDMVTTFSFAMAYNRYCWAAFSILSLVLFLPPRRPSGAWIDVAVGGALIVTLFYFKLTYFAAALGELAVAFVVSHHVRAHRGAWAIAGTLAIANAIAPFNWAYLGDFLAALRAGAVRDDPIELVTTLFSNVAELSLYTTALVITVALWRSQRAPLRLPVATALLIMMGLAVLSQNAQARGVPLGTVIAFLLYDHVRVVAAGAAITTNARDYRAMRWLLLAFLVFPVAYVGRTVASVAAYHYKATHVGKQFVVDRTNLRGLTVPADPPGLLDAFSSGQVDYTLFRRTRMVGPRYELSQFEYVQTLLEAATLFDEPGKRPGGIVVMDQVNPLPFMLGRPPPRGGNLWLDAEFPAQPAAAMFAEAAYVLIPKYSTSSPVTANAIDLYGAYLEEHFPERMETRSWILCSRRSGAR